MLKCWHVLPQVAAKSSKEQQMSKEVDKLICSYCESEYKLMYDLDNTSGHPKFCPFCASDIFEEEPESEQEDE